MHDDFLSLYAYNHWANRRVLEACAKLTPQQYVAEAVAGGDATRRAEPGDGGDPVGVPLEVPRNLGLVERGCVGHSCPPFGRT